MKIFQNAFAQNGVKGGNRNSPKPIVTLSTDGSGLLLSRTVTSSVTLVASRLTILASSILYDPPLNAFLFDFLVPNSSAVECDMEGCADRCVLIWGVIRW